jgi:glycolate oxidase
VFTKCALKLCAWPGPATIPVEGTAPAYKAVLPDNFRVYTLAFPTWQSFADTCHMIWDAGIGYIAHRQFNMFGRDIKFAMLKILTDPSAKLNDLEELAKDADVKKVNDEMKRDFQIVLAGMTARDIAWQDKALDTILASTGGWKVAAMNDPTMRDWSLLYLIRLGHKNLNLVFAGGYDGCFGLAGPPDYGIKYVEEAGEFKSQWEKKGAIVETGGDCMMGGIATIGGGATVVWENFTCFDPYDKKSTDGTYEFFEATSKYGISKKWGSGMERSNAASRGIDGRATPKEVRDKMLSGSSQPLVFRYQRMVKDAFDPNNLGDEYYQTL